MSELAAGTDAAARPERLEIAWSRIAIAFFIVAAAAVRLHVVALPLERDEGEYAYIGQLLLHGIPPYKIAFNMKWPGTYAMYALSMAVFGQTVVGIRIGLIVVTSVTALLSGAIAKRIGGYIAGTVATAVSLFLSLSPGAFGLAGHATHFVALFATAGALLLLRGARERTFSVWKLFFSGVMFALAVVMKQQAIFFPLFGLLWIALDRHEALRTRARLLLAYAAGGAATIATMLGLLAASGVLRPFWFWTITYASRYVQQLQRAYVFEALRMNLGAVLFSFPVIWLFVAAATAAAVTFHSSRRDKMFLLGMSLAAIASTMPGLYFRNHYFITAFPSAAIWCGIGVAAFRGHLQARNSSWTPIAVTASAVVLLLSAGTAVRDVVIATPETLMRRMYTYNPFPEAVQIGTYIQRHTAAGEPIGVVGSEPEIYFYADRRAATGYIYTYPLMEIHPFAHEMQLDMIRQLEQNNVRYLVVANVSSSWLRQEQSDTTILSWIETLPQRGYEPELVAAIGTDGTQWFTGGDAWVAARMADESMIVFRRVR